MSNVQLFKQAHAMTKQVIKAGDCYRTTFGACLKAIKADIKQADSVNLFTVIAAIVAMVTAKISVINGDVIYRNNASLITIYHTSRLLSVFKWCVIFSPIVIAMLALLSQTAVTTEDIKLPTKKGYIVYANKDGQKAAFEVTTASSEGFVAKELYNRKITIFKMVNNEIVSSDGFVYDIQASEDWAMMYDKEQKRLAA